MIRNKWIPNHFVISIKYIKNYQKLLLAASLSTTSVSTTSGESKLRWGVFMFPANEKWRSLSLLDAWITRIHRARRAKSGILQSVEVQNFRGFSTISQFADCKYCSNWIVTWSETDSLSADVQSFVAECWATRIPANVFDKEMHTFLGGEGFIKSIDSPFSASSLLQRIRFVQTSFKYCSRSFSSGTNWSVLKPGSRTQAIMCIVFIDVQYFFSINSLTRTFDFEIIGKSSGEAT